ncbi:MAG: hypothetical protein E7265_00675 [Lachnospiraceae bacterium]|nr:hypothetical protein [Lachnospiraceae bacterium]
MSCFFKTRKEGSIFKMFPILLGISAITVLALMFFGFMKDMDVREQASFVAREYMLKMESIGYLDNYNCNMLINDLQEIGVENINLTGSTIQDVGYGNEIVLVINAKAPVTEFEITDVLGMQANKRMTDISIVRKSTAKN